MSSISFAVRQAAGGPAEAVVPIVDGVDLTSLIGEYEGSQGFDVVGGYDGIIPGHFNFGPLPEYFLGAADDPYWGKVGKIAVLGCECGEVGCWPLYASVVLSSATVTWSDFEQPYRRQRDYSGFGPFTFGRDEYVASVSAAAEALHTREG